MIPENGGSFARLLQRESTPADDDEAARNGLPVGTWVVPFPDWHQTELRIDRKSGKVERKKEDSDGVAANPFCCVAIQTPDTERER